MFLRRLLSKTPAKETKKIKGVPAKDYSIEDLPT